MRGLGKPPLNAIENFVHVPALGVPDLAGCCKVHWQCGIEALDKGLVLQADPEPNSVGLCQADLYSTAALAWLPLHLMMLPNVPQLWALHHSCGPACRLCHA